MINAFLIYLTCSMFALAKVVTVYGWKHPPTTYRARALGFAPVGRLDGTVILDSLSAGAGVKSANPVHLRLPGGNVVIVPRESFDPNVFRPERTAATPNRAQRRAAAAAKRRSR